MTPVPASLPLPLPPRPEEATPRQRLVALAKPGHAKSLSDDEGAVLAALGAVEHHLVVGFRSGAGELLGDDALPVDLLVAAERLAEVGLIELHRFVPADPDLAFDEGWLLVLRSRQA